MTKSILKNKALKSLALAAVTVFSIILAPIGAFAQEQQAPAGFSDVTRTHPYYVGITYLNQSGVINGYADGTFKPQQSINRAEVLKVILGGSGIAPATAFTQDFPDVGQNDWFAPYVLKARELGFVKGNDGDGTFAPGRQVNLAEFLKMLLAANNINTDAVAGKEVVKGLPVDAWYAPYLNYSAALGIIGKSGEQIDPGKPMTRGEVANTMYLLSLILKGKDTQFMLSRAEAEMAQIEVYIAANQIALAKASSELAVDLTQQAYKNMPDNNVVLGAAKIARAYDWLVDSFVLGVQQKFEEAAQKANDAIDKAGEAWESNNATQPIAKHIKDRAREILAQVGGTEN